MTISDYKVTDNATLALIAKQNEIDGSQVLNLLECEICLISISHLFSILERGILVKFFTVDQNVG